MPKSTTVIAEEVSAVLSSERKDVVTYSLSAFYKLVDRERIKEQFRLDLVSSLKQANLVIAFGDAAVLIAKDYNFSPSKT